MNRLWIITPEVVLRSERKTSMSYDDEEEVLVEFINSVKEELGEALI